MSGDGRQDWGPVIGASEVGFALWAPAQERLALRIGGRDIAMTAQGDGWFCCEAPLSEAGAEYAYLLEDGRTVPDPAARAQARDVHGPSRLVDPDRYEWRHDRPGRAWREAVIYELHIGAFTPEGTFAAAAERMGALADLGVTAIEIMPVAQFAGDRGWGYDGVLPYAVHPAYGTPDQMRALVDAAHGAGLMVLLDVVYNHFGPEGNYLNLYAPEFFHPEQHTPWGAAIAYDREPVRRFFVENALYWLRDFRLDGLRLDAIDHVKDDSDPEILVEIAREVRREFPDAHLTTEDNRNITHLHEREDGRAPLYTAEWNDDWHNAAHVIATGEDEGYYADFADTPHAHLARALAEGFAYQGQVSPQKDAPRGGPSAHLPPVAFVDFLQNHDQAGNRAFGERIDALAPAPAVRALRAILLLSPHIPLMFMGEEYGEERPFLFFTDFHGDLADAVRQGRRREFAGFAAFEDGATDAIPDPNAPETFAASRIDWARRDGAGQARLEETGALLRVRRREIVPLLAGAGAHTGRVIDAEADVVAVDWRLDGARISLRANLGDGDRAAPAAPGRVIWGPVGARTWLGPWQVRFTRQEGLHDA
ncbi:malto-oligosyltrehalose trehalohydrolase [Roseovarius spongiae]|uniref:Malto-oligosyltrehalose trehalohydrolase n=1 Tax=Roseovarius spongiae TaxID=2320272 RepID=A0A3A8B1V2_9RHOB|nr:malto-oligosyltrehalose trehalohydrolase [Roseovarius spongiae]RKF12630.1 malto-oligosyltrehalose trehalohydrolase [Roseovarius spongiae]